MQLSIYLIVTALLFGGSLLGFLLNRNNLILLVINLELMLLAVNTNFIVFATLWNDINGQIYVLFNFVVGVVHVALAIVLLFNWFGRNRQGDDVACLSGNARDSWHA